MFTRNISYKICRYGLLTLATFFLLHSYTFANTRNVTDIQSLTQLLIYLISRLEILIFILATTLFMYGLIKFVVSDSPDKKQNAKKFIINGIIILTVMISVRSLVLIIRNTFNLSSEGRQLNPTSQTIDSLRRQ